MLSARRRAGQAVREQAMAELWEILGCQQVLTELVSDRGGGALVSVQEASSGCGLPLVSLAHAWELLSQAPVPEAK